MKNYRVLWAWIFTLNFLLLVFLLLSIYELSYEVTWTPWGCENPNGACNAGEGWLLLVIPILCLYVLKALILIFIKDWWILLVNIINLITYNFFFLSPSGKYSSIHNVIQPTCILTLTIIHVFLAIYFGKKHSAKDYRN